MTLSLPSHRFPAAAASAVRVSAPARLHLGFFDLHGGLGRSFGSLGTAVDGLSTVVSARRADEFVVHGEQAARALSVARALLQSAGVDEGVELRIEQALPEHVGLGSGTQLALAVGTALARLFGLALDTRALAAVLDRGRRSGIGIGAFDHGGFLVDGGRQPEGDAPPPLIAQLPVPSAWRWILLFDPAHRGLSGAPEARAFAALARFPERQAERLCRLVLMQLLPALAEADIDGFGAALTDLQDCVGDHFAPAQSGRYASATVGRALDLLRRAGACAVGQTSWGPTGFALASTAQHAQRLLAECRADPMLHGLRPRVCATRPGGALVEVFADAGRPRSRAAAVAAWPA
ncbi:MAG: GHMP kinase [Betaproteobacteria bacterium]|nr:GHMP kinase [Betaproteobacteria bacterium]